MSAVPLIERRDELDAALKWMAVAGDHVPTIVLITGEAGQGKTRLVEELAEQARARAAAVVFGHCSPVGASRLAYLPIRSVLRGLVNRWPDLLDSVDAPVRQAVAVLFGAVAFPPPAAQAWSAQLFAAVVDVIAAASERAPLCVVLEDVHWADAETLDLLDFLMREFTDERVLVVLTQRVGATPRGAPARLKLAELRRMTRCHSISVGPLSDAGVKQLLTSMTAPGADPEQLGRVVQLAGGNPFFAIMMAEKNSLAAGVEAVSDLVLAGLDECAPAARELLAVLHVLGGCDDLRDLADAMTVDLPLLDTLVRELFDARLLTADGRALRVRHALVGEALDAELLPSERIIAHGRAADLLLAKDNLPARATQLAHHLLGAGRATEALPIAMQSARHAMSTWAFREALTSFEAVLRLWSVVPGADTLTGLGRADVAVEAATAYRWCGQAEDALALLDTVNAPDSRAASRLAYARGLALDAAGRLAPALTAYADAIADAGGDIAFLADAHAAAARAHLVSGAAAQSELSAAAAIGAARAAGATRAELHATVTQAASQAQLGHAEGALASLQACSHLIRAGGDLELVLRYYGNLTFCLGIAGKTEEVLHAAARGLAECARFGPVVSVASSLISNYVSALSWAGRWEDATATAAAALRETTSSSMALHLWTDLAAIAVARGELADARGYLDQARRLVGDSPYAVEVEFVAAELALALDDPADALRRAEESLTDLVSQEDDLLVLDGCRLALRAISDGAISGHAIAGGDTVERLLALARTAAAHTTLPLALCVAATCEAEVSRSDGTASFEQWQEIVSAEKALGRPSLAAYGLFRAGECLATTDSPEASAVLTQALGEAVRLGARPMADLITRAAGRAGLAVSIRATQTARPDTLTDREREVLSLISRGLSNRAIAHSLVISQRTVDVHVGKVLAKLGAENRTQAVHIAGTRGIIINI